jgi:hypothetical protein
MRLPVVRDDTSHVYALFKLIRRAVDDQSVVATYNPVYALGIGIAIAAVVVLGIIGVWKYRQSFQSTGTEKARKKSVQISVPAIRSVPRGRRSSRWNTPQAELASPTSKSPEGNEKNSFDVPSSENVVGGLDESMKPAASDPVSNS